jgi:hypothetical protein
LNDLQFSIDLAMAQSRAEKIIECIKGWRERHDIQRFEFTKHVGLAAAEIPHSHPVLTLNTQLYNPESYVWTCTKRCIGTKTN